MKTAEIPQKMQKYVLHWFDQFGRKDLPWQQNKTPYRVWVSEIMLQQTQVSTVIPYFQRFMSQFPEVEFLAKASEDEVLHLWTGLGYYSRARNLHRTAKIVMQSYHGNFPMQQSELENLPGIGRSTAGAILALGFQKKAVILDGNVKRVLTRLHGIQTWPNEKNTLEKLWLLAEKYTPNKRIADYTQAIMDLGATVCVRGKPRCEICPLQKDCIARKKGIAKKLPVSKPKKTLPIRQITLLIFQKENVVLLEKRPASGIWASLWSFPETFHSSPDEIKKFCKPYFSTREIRFGETFRHTFTHFHLDILPVFISIKKTKNQIMEGRELIWYNLQTSQKIGLPAPINLLLRGMHDSIR